MALVGNTVTPHKVHDAQSTADARQSTTARDVKRMAVQCGARIRSRLGREKTTRFGTTRRKKLTLRQTFLLFRRFLVLVAAILYIKTSIEACTDSRLLLTPSNVAPFDHQVYESKLVARYAGTESIRQSPLVAALGNATTPRSSGSLFLEDDSTHFAGCTSYAESTIYQDTFQRKMFEALRSSLAYSLPFLDPANAELILPVIDCTFTALVIEDITAPRFFYLMRDAADLDDVYIVAVTMSIQEYRIDGLKTVGPAAVATIAAINDMRDTSVEHHFALALGYPFKEPKFETYRYYDAGQSMDHWWVLKSVPPNAAISVPKVVSTTCPTGFYISSPKEQANIMYLIWRLYQSPSKVLSDWMWTGNPVVHDSWAWVHLLHLYFAVNAAIGLCVMATVTFYNVRAGRFWLGDAFVAVSSVHWSRSVLVFASWYMDEFWSLLEFALLSGTQLERSRTLFVYTSIMRADLLALYITLVSTIGEVCKERIDPALMLGCFLVGFEARLEIAKLFPGMVKALVDYSNLEYLLGIIPLDPSIPERSPVRVWSSKHVPKVGVTIVLSTLLPVFSTLVFIVAYVIGRKLHRWKYPDLVAQQRSSLNSAKESDGRRSNLTQFEFATGVALRDRFGVVSDYDNYVYIKGMTFASADGIYTSAFVIANGKFLVSIDDLIAIVVIKLTHVRFRNVFVYDVDGNAVKQTARLVYPETMSLRDLMHLNLKILL